MKISYNWICELLDIPVSASELAQQLTMIGLKLEGMDAVAGDTSIDLEVTVNRPDCLSIYGVAREAALLFDLIPPQLPEYRNTIEVSGRTGEMKANSLSLKIVIEDPELCARYCGQLLSGVRVGPSPDWLKNKLEVCGIRSINNVVDVTNYVMLELGQPLHAFDYSKLAEGTIRVRQATDEKLILLDDREHLLRPPVLVIADAHRPVAVAGVMGGKETEVTESTTTVLLESAWFLPQSVRKTAKYLELSTDASYRFERGADPEMQACACQRAADLIVQLTGATAYPALDVTARKLEKRRLSLRPDRISRILGEPISDDFVHRILSGLGFKPIENHLWEVPSFRVDIEREIDLIEEIARHYGYNRFANTLPPAEKKYQPDYPTYQLERSISLFLQAARVDEANTYSFVPPVPDADPPRISLKNPISEAASQLRTSLIPGLLESVKFNFRHRIQEVRLFEIGRLFLPAGEKVALGIVITGDYLDLKGLLESMMPALRYQRPVFQGEAICIGNHPIGWIREETIENTPVACAEIFLSDLIHLRTIPIDYQPIIPYPFVERDVTFIIGDDIPYSHMQQLFSDIDFSELKSYRLIDRYKGPSTPLGKVSITFHLVFQGDDRTLTSQEVDEMQKQIIERFRTTFGAELRQ